MGVIKANEIGKMCGGEVGKEVSGNQIGIPVYDHSCKPDYIPNMDEMMMDGNSGLENPFKSHAQRRFMFAAEQRGELPKGTAERWAHETPNMKKLPERLHRKGA